MSSTSEEDTPPARTDEDNTKSQTKDEPSDDEEAIRAIQDALDKDPGNESLAQALELLYLREKDPKAFDKFIVDADEAAARSGQSITQHTDQLTVQPAAQSTAQPHPPAPSSTRRWFRQGKDSTRSSVPPRVPPSTRLRPSRLNESMPAPAIPTPESGGSAGQATSSIPSASASSEVAATPARQEDMARWMTLPLLTDEFVSLPVDPARPGEPVILQTPHSSQQFVRGPATRVRQYDGLWHAAYSRSDFDPRHAVVDLENGIVIDLSIDQAAERFRRRIASITGSTSR